MKKLFAILLSILVLTGLLAALPVAAAGSATITASKSTVTIGEKVTVTAKYSGGNTGIGSLDAYFTYNANVFEYVSCSGATAKGGAGSIIMSYFCQDLEAPKSVTISVTLKAKAPGAGDFKWETEDMSDDNGNSLGNPSKSLSVTASDPTRSGDATLSFLSPSKGTLNPKFDKNVTEYTVSVPYTVTRCLLNYSTTDIYATSKITDNADLQVGKTVRVITVTAQNGTTKKYTVTITREAQQSTASPTGTTSATDTTTTTNPETPPAEDALEVSVDGVNMLISGTRPEAELPAGFVWETTMVNEVEVPAGRHEFAELTLLYLTDMEGEDGAYYLYDADTDTFTDFRQLTVKGGAYVLHNLPDTETGPAGTLPSTFAYEGGEITAYRYEDSKLADYVLVWATAPGGETGLYSYDTVEETFQRHYTVTMTVTVTKPTSPQEAEPKPKESDAWVAVSNFFQTYGPWMLVGLIGLVALVVIGFALFMLVSFLLSLLRGKKGKH